MPDTVETRIARIEESTRAIVDIWKLQQTQGTTQFQALSDALGELDNKVDNLRIAEAKRQGEAIAIKRTAGVIATITSLFVAVLAAVIKHFSGV